MSSTAPDTVHPSWPASRLLLGVEMVLLFGVAPVLVAALLGVVNPIAMLLGLVCVALALLARTPDFAMRELLQGPVLGEWRLILGFSVLSGVAMLALAAWLVPGHVLGIVRARPGLWLMIMLLYPLLSALPQEIVFRTLFFRRYGRLFGGRHAALAVNGPLFALAHLFFLNPLTLAMTLVGGWIFAWAYLRNRSTLLAVVLHGIAGQLIFTSGLGIYFYHGAIAA